MAPRRCLRALGLSLLALPRAVQAYRSTEQLDLGFVVGAGHAGGRRVPKKPGHAGHTGAGGPTDANFIAKPSNQLTKFVNLMSQLRLQGDAEMEAVALLDDFVHAEPLMSLGAVSTGTWEYAWKHLPSILMDHADMRIVFHSPAAHFVPEDPAAGIFTFAGWETDGGSFVEKEECTGKKCTLHVNLRDLYTDLDEFVSNLLLHVRFLQQNPGVTIHRCLDRQSIQESCRGREKCWLSSEMPPPDCKSPTAEPMLVPEIPTYSLGFEGFGSGEAGLVESLRVRWKVWSDRLLKMSLDLSRCPMEDLKVHVVQGATEAMWVMTSEYAQSEQPDVELEGQYGGRFEEADRRYARFLKASKQDKSLTQRLNGQNAGKHLYDPMSGPFSVSTELVSMESWTRAGEVDPVVTEELLARSAVDRKCAVLLNVGYAFGSASWPMGLALRDSFGAALKSFHVIGKAGGLAGGVGDYQVPSSFFLWDRVGAPASAAPEVYRIDVSKVDLSLWSGKQPQVHSGGLMTVPSVVLQSHHLLDAAKLPPWGAVGIEMESLWFKRALPDTPGLYLYYTSDIPQAADSSLAHESYPWAEGQTLFNGLARMVLVDILSNHRP